MAAKNKSACCSRRLLREGNLLLRAPLSRRRGSSCTSCRRLWGQKCADLHRARVEGAVRGAARASRTCRTRSCGATAAIIVPSGIVADRLRYTEDVNKIPPATEFLKRAFAEKQIIKGIICHGMWLVAPAPELVRGRRVVGAQQPDRRREGVRRDLHRPGRRRGRRPRDRPHRRPLPPVRAARSSTCWPRPRQRRLISEDTSNGDRLLPSRCDFLRRPERRPKRSIRSTSASAARGRSRSAAATRSSS